MNSRRFVSCILLSALLAFFFIRCGSKRTAEHKGAVETVSVTKSGKLGTDDTALDGSSNSQKHPVVAFDPANKRFLAVWLESTPASSWDIKGKWIFLRSQESVSQNYTFPVNIYEVLGYDSNGNAITPTVTGLNSSSLTVNVAIGTTLLLSSGSFTIQPNVTDDSGIRNPTPSVAFGYNDSGSQNFIVLWSDYKNDGGTTNGPKIIGKLYDKNCSEVKTFYVAGTSTAFYTYSSAIYNLTTNVNSEGQYEPAVSFDIYNKRFVVAWVDKNGIENKYRLAPKSGLVTGLTNPDTTEAPVFDSSTGIVDDRMVVYRYLDIDGNPIKDPDDITNRRSINLYSDLDVESSGISEDIKLALTNIKSYKFENSPKLATDNRGKIMLSFKANQVTSTVFFNYSSDSFPNTYINRGPFGGTAVTGFTISPADIFFRNIKSNKDVEKKLYSTQLSNPDKAVAGTNVDSFSVTNLSENNFILVWSQNEGGVNKIKAAIANTGTFSLGSTVEVAGEKNSYNPVVTITSNGEVFVLYERYDNETGKRDIYGRYLLQTLDSDTDNFMVSTGTATRRFHPSIASDNTGKSFILFEDDRIGKTNIFSTLYSRITPLTRPALYLNYTSVDFGTVYINDSRKKYLSVTNQGNGDLSITDAGISSPFQSFSSVQTIEPGKSGTVGIKFAPAYSGRYVSTLNLSTNDPVKPALTVTVRGVAQAGVIINTAGFSDKTDIKSDYYFKLTATTVSEPSPVYKWSVVKGTLPDGITLNEDTGVLSGKATKTGTFDFEIMARELKTGLSSESVSLRITVYEDIAYAEKGSFKCFIATAAYGSYLHPHVAVLRSFRDNVLLGTFNITLFGKSVTIENIPGKLFVKTYYRYSPPLADFIARKETVKFITRLFLTPVVLFVKYLEHLLAFSFSVLVIRTLRKK